MKLTAIIKLNNLKKERFFFAKIYKKPYNSDEYDIQTLLKKNNYFVDFYNYYDRIGYEMYIYEYYESNKLFNLIKEGLSIQKKEELFMKLYKFLIKACRFIHSYNIIHCDITLLNILIHKKTEEIKLCNFSKSILLNYNNTKSSNIIIEKICGTIEYLPPESYIIYTYSKKNDVWAIGIVLYYLLFDEFPFSYTYQSDYEQEKKIKIAISPDTIKNKIELKYKNSTNKDLMFKILTLTLTNIKERSTTLKLIKELQIT